jgi:hypothetical protein
MSQPKHSPQRTDHTCNIMSNPGSINGPVENGLEADEEVSLGQLSEDDDETIGSITAAALAALSLLDPQRPRSAMATATSGGSSVGGAKRKRTCSTSAAVR